MQVVKNFLLLINIFQMKYLQNDLITPLERLAESDVLYVKVHSTKKCMFLNLKGYIISKLWLQNYVCYGKIPGGGGLPYETDGDARRLA